MWAFSVLASPKWHSVQYPSFLELVCRLTKNMCILTGDDDEFDDAVPIGRCSAIYHYTAQQYDELSIQPGLCG